MARWLIYYNNPMTAINGEKQTKHYIGKTRWEFIAILFCAGSGAPWLFYEKEDKR